MLSLGSRLSIRQVGYNYKTWAREAFTIVVDIDENELKKPTLRIDLPICADVKVVLEMLKSKLENKPCGKKEKWHQTCTNWKYKYPVVMKKHYEDTDCTNVYCFTKELSNYLPEDYITVVGNGSACVVGSHAYTIKKGQRFIINSAIVITSYSIHYTKLYDALLRPVVTAMVGQRPSRSTRTGFSLKNPFVNSLAAFIFIPYKSGLNRIIVLAG